MIRLLPILFLLSCGGEEVNTRGVHPVHGECVTDEPPRDGEDGLQGPQGTQGESIVGPQGDTGIEGSEGIDGSDGISCSVDKILVKTKRHHRHSDYYYDVVVVCGDTSEVISKGVRYHEEI